MADFTGKVALVTGTTGIGRAVALRLAQGGASVMALGIDDAGNAALADANGAIHVRRTDVADAGQVEAAFREIERQFGGLDVIVANAERYSSDALRLIHATSKQMAQALRAAQ